MSSEPLGEFVPIMSPLIKAALNDAAEYDSIDLLPLTNL
jgi:hypothetical protein